MDKINDGLMVMIKTSTMRWWRCTAYKFLLRSLPGCTWRSFSRLLCMMFCLYDMPAWGGARCSSGFQCRLHTSLGVARAGYSTSWCPSPSPWLRCRRSWASDIIGQRSCGMPPCAAASGCAGMSGRSSVRRGIRCTGAACSSGSRSPRRTRGSSWGPVLSWWY